MLAAKITKARELGQKIVHKPELKDLSEIALKTVANNYLLYKKLEGLDFKYKIKVYEIMSVDYDIEDIFPIIDYEPYWERVCRKQFKSENCSSNGNSWKQCYAENYVKNLITNYRVSEGEKILEELKRVCNIVKYHIFNLDIPTFSCSFDISFIPQYFLNLTSLSLKYSPILRDHDDDKNQEIFTKKLKPIEDEYSQFGIRIPDLKKFCVLITDLSYFLSLTLCGNLVDDEMIKWLVPGLITNQTLRELDLSSNRITEKGMIKIASYLVRTRSLVSIDLSNNLIGGESSFAIGLVLKENTKLKILKLAMNRFDDLNGSRIVKMLAKNNYLEELDLSTNLLGAETVKNLNLALKFNSVIKSIDLSHNELSMDEETLKIAETHPSLGTLDLRHTNSNEELLKKLDDVLIKKAIKLQLTSKNHLN